jgi:hypothetical protein
MPRTPPRLLAVADVPATFLKQCRPFLVREDALEPTRATPKSNSQRINESLIDLSATMVMMTSC